MKKIIRIWTQRAALLLACSLLALLSAKAQFAGGTGSLASPYIITTPEQLDKVRDNLAAFYKLGQDIDLTGYLTSGGAGYTKWGTSGWDPIGKGPAGSATNAFRGGFDGDGYKITGLWIDRPSETLVGLFGHAVNATIENLGVELAPALAGITGSSNVGALVGRIAAQSGGRIYINNCYVIGTVYGTGSSGNIGGLVGALSINTSCTGVIENCYTAGSVSSSNNNAGGLVGYRFTGGISTIQNCYSTSDVKGYNFIGGLIGHQQTGSGTLTGAPNPSNAECYIKNCYTTGKITANQFAGGILGRQHNYDNGSKTDISYCFTTGDITGNSNSGGIVGTQTLAFPLSNTLADNFRYELATINSNPVNQAGPDHGRALRHGDNSATADDFMTKETYSTATTRYLASAWLFGTGNPWQWVDSEKYPMLNLTGEVYPFPFYAITYILNGGDPLPSGTRASYDPRYNTPYTLPTPTKTGYVFADWYDNAGFTGSPITAIISTDKGHKTFYAKWNQAPGITGPTTMTQTVGYAATFTSAYTVTGSPAPVVTISGNAAITWNNTMQRLDIAAGLAVGNYPVVLTASNGIAPDATITFTLMVIPPSTFTVVYDANGGSGTQTDPKNPYPTGSLVTILGFGSITYYPYAFTGWNTKADGSGISYRAGETFIIRSNTTLYAQWDENPNNFIRFRRLITVAPTINGSVICNQLFAATRDTVALTILPAPGYVLDEITLHCAYDESITFPLFMRDGDICTFLMRPYEVIIRATFKLDDKTGIWNVAQEKSLKAYVANGMLYVSGLAEGATLKVYNITGTLIYTTSPNPSERGEQFSPLGGVSLPGRGIYIVTDDKTAIRVVN